MIQLCFCWLLFSLKFMLLDGLQIEGNPRIVGGSNTTIEEYPYQVSVQYLNSHTCGGSIISKNFILTAGHCIRRNRSSNTVYSIIAGNTFRNKTYGVNKTICEIYVHNKYDEDTIDYDIALLKTCDDLTFSKKVLPIALPYFKEELRYGTMADVSGWGLLNENADRAPVILQKVQVPIISGSSCNKYYKDEGITNRMMCAGYKLGGKDSCQGDSGGPLRAKGKLFGVVSWGDGCAREGKPGVYTKVAYFRNWIKRIANV